MKEKRKEKDVLSKKHKKSKKKHKKKYDSSSDSNSSEDKMVWVEADAPKAKEKKKKSKKHKKYASSSNTESSDSEHESYSKVDSPVQSCSTEKRESWMDEESFVPTLSKEEMYVTSHQKRMDSQQKERERQEKVQRDRELNPYLKNEGSGLPEKESNVDSLSLPSTSVGDGGYSWLKKAYYRIQEQSQLEGRSMEEIAVERWGSLKKLTSLIEEAEERMKSHPDFKHSRSQYMDKNNRDRRCSKPRFKEPSTACESERNVETSFRFLKPSADSKNRKVLNEFKSSRKYSYKDYDESDDRSLCKSLNTSHEETAASKKQDLTVRGNDFAVEKRIPAWKKPKYSAENLKEEKMPVDSPPENSNQKSNTSEQDSIPVIYCDDDLNKLAAKQTKAEIMGDHALAEKLKCQLDEARSIVKEKGFAVRSHKKVEEEVELMKVDGRGQFRPVQTTQEAIEGYKVKQKRSNKFFDDGSRHSLKQMFEREKLTTADDHMEMFVEASAHSNETAEIDYESGHISKKLSQKLSASRAEERDIGKAIQQHQKHTAALEKCEYCLNQPRMKKYLIVDVGEQVYLCLPNFQTLAKGHCLIVPKAHVSSFLSLDENEWKEVNDFKNQLRRLFRSDNKSVIFLETSMHFRYFPHAVVECIPVPVEDGDMAPFYFKKAIQESESEWAQNKKLIDLTNKGLRNSVPKGLPYFHAEFDPQVHAGFAHVIEDEKYFPRNFGKEVVGGLLEVDYNFLYKNKRDDPLKKAEDVTAFEQMWKKFSNID